MSINYTFLNPSQPIWFMLSFLYKPVIKGKLILMEKIPKNNRYGYVRVSSKEQTQNSYLDAQKAELIQLSVPE
jgi:hypothetical protein